MIEAVNATISSAPSVKAIAQQVSSAESLAANPARTQKAAVSAPYLSPHVRLSPGVKPIFVVRDLNTGEAVRQFPSESQIVAYQKAAQAQEFAARLERVFVPNEAQSLEQAEAVVESSVQYKEARKAVKESAPLPGSEVKVAGGGGDKPAPVATPGGRVGETLSTEA